MEDSQLPSPAGTQLLVDVRGAEIVSSSSEDPEVYLPHHEEMISHIALDIGGSLAKVVYFTRAPPSKPTQPSSSSPFTESPTPSDPSSPESQPISTNHSPFPNRRTPSPPSSEPAKPNGILGPRSLSQKHINLPPSSSSASPSRSNHHSHRTSAYPPFQSHLRRRSSASRIPPGGRLNFIKFETSKLTALINFLQTLITSSAASNRVPLEVMKKNVKIMATGGGAHKFYERLKRELGVEVRREEEMECLVLGLGFVMEVPNEVFWYSDELVQAISHPQQRALSSVNVPSTPGRSATPLPIPPPSPSVELSGFTTSILLDPSSTTSATAPFSTTRPISPTPSIEDLPRPSPNPPQYSISFDSNPTPAQFPCLLVNIGSGVSIIKIDDYGKFERISGTSLGGGTLWGLLSLLTGSKSFDDMLALADRGDNSSVDMLVGDIYGQDYQKIGLKSSTIASSFGKVFKKGESGGGDDSEEEDGHGDGDGEDEEEERKKSFKPEDISRSLLYAISNNIGQIAYMNAEKHNLDRIYFGGGFIRGHAATISTLSYAIRFWSKGTKRALFLRHEGYLGGIGAWLKNLEPATSPPPPSVTGKERGREGTPSANGVEERLGKLGLTEVEDVAGGIRES
ncbi:hypothetical protein JCM16303_002305 [Sporobolomyces ruberrimus]